MFSLGPRCSRPFTLRPALIAPPSSLTVMLLRFHDDEPARLRIEPVVVVPAAGLEVLRLVAVDVEVCCMRMFSELTGWMIQNGVFLILTPSIRMFLLWYELDEGRPERRTCRRRHPAGGGTLMTFVAVDDRNESRA